MGLYQRLWQNLGGLHQFVFYYLTPSSSYGLSLLVKTRKTILTEIHVENEGMSCLCRSFHMLLTIMCSITLQGMHVNEMGL